MFQRGEYEVGTVFADPSRSRVPADEITRAGHAEVVDVSGLLAARPEVACLFMRDLRPGPTSTMVAAVAALGYTRVLILDPQLMRVTTGRGFIRARPAPPVPPQLSPQRRYDSWDMTNIDVGVLLAAVAAFPETSFEDVTTGALLARLLEPAPKVPTGDRLVPEAKSREARTNLSALLPVGPDGRELRCAYVTMCDSADYLWGVRALANSLAKVSDVPLILMVPPGADFADAVFESGNVRLHDVNSLRNPHQLKSHQLRFANTFTKLEVFGLTFLDRAVFLDADTIVLGETDPLFAYEGFAAAPDFGLRLENRTFNSGVFVVSPNSDEYLRILDSIPTTPSYDGGDQGFLNVYQGEITWLPPEFNTLRRVITRFPDVIPLKRARVLHYVGPKPWGLEGEPEWSSLDELWFEQLSDRERIEFIVQLRDRVSVAARRAPAQRGRGPAGAVRPRRRKDFERAQDALSNGRPGEAIEISRAALRRNPQSLANRRVLALALKSTGHRRDELKVRIKTRVLKAKRLLKGIVE